MSGTAPEQGTAGGAARADGQLPQLWSGRAARGRIVTRTPVEVGGWQGGATAAMAPDVPGTPDPVLRSLRGAQQE